MIQRHMTHEAIARQFYALINGLDNGHALWTAAVTEQWTASPAFPSAPNQVAGYPLAIAAFRKGFPDLRFRIDEVVIRDAFVAIHLTVTGTHQDEFSSIPATGKMVCFTAMDIHRIDNGRIAETWHAEDFTKMVAQLKA
jgi:steroid delta-isomerase-like uncharacterized protein